MNRSKVLHGSIDVAILVIGGAAGLVLSNSRLIPEYARYTGIAVAIVATLLAFGLHSLLRINAAQKLQLNQLAHAFTWIDAPLESLYHALRPNRDSSGYLSWKMDYLDRNGGILRILAMINTAGTLPEIENVTVEDAEAIMELLDTAREASMPARAA